MMTIFPRSFCVVFCLLLGGCWSAAEKEVVVYCALDREFSEPILDDFEKKTGIKVLAKYDVESTKSVGHANAIIQEKKRPRCDLFWNNEILQTLRLQKHGLLEAYHPEAAKKFPAVYRSMEGLWHGFAARTRVLIVNTELVPEGERPNSILDLIDPKWKGKVGVAKPLFGTTSTHAAVLFAAWGGERAKDFFTKLQGNALIMSGNKQVAVGVAKKELAFGITDTDDAIIEKDKGMPVTIVYPDQMADGEGALFIPNTLALIKGSKNGEHAKRLIDYLLMPEIEERLAKGESAQFPLHADVSIRPRVQPENEIRHMKADFEAGAEGWKATASFLRDVFTDE